ncbi:DUF2971 domain-containing protein [Laribacter hongkongensis]|uniref:DUF2971 domain-containing protein n=1 Tax=Laribacter hongkongensis TaxID=168471 RepID=A0ABD4SW27_9NEIS|nr:DUF2971 domain-containing protein [Laribacter hongkongensis]MCG9026746.1 DUF2971 domain-containing protein [Laribacter hongkongensis]MCG9101630.1 DUF2971 domain-containing protein [Laribacter hongkongensis]MCG9104244.1 DUF2971 domain-containing protein [Laribacter hongkongensis]MCG9113477.1 DUF2971 domain-containing protein [Laribacter hongkongensis]MCG9119215.1 DUF2971 domain-containing protein [Laribacter hongkongensis]
MSMLFHYTSIDAFISIVRYKKIWLTDICELNDYSEKIYAIQKFEEILKRRFDEKKLSANYYNAIIQELDFVAKAYEHYYIFSLSRSPDDLGQWVHYGDGGKGVSIGFNREHLTSLLSKLKQDKELHGNVTMQPVYYDAHDVGILKVFEGIDLSGDCVEYNDVKYLLRRVFNLVYVYKNSAFSSEKEERIVFECTVGKYEDVVKVNYGLDLCFRNSDGRIINYFELPLDGLNELHVLIGPKCKSTKENIEFFMRRNGIKNATARCSEVPYR